jgi:hypothetical protein
MFENRISEQLQLTGFVNLPTNVVVCTSPATAAQLFPMVSTQDIYQMAAAKARYDYELDKLFNPDYYGDNGSGI